MKKIFETAVCLIVLTMLLVSTISAADRGVTVKSRWDGAALQKRFSAGTNHALIIGIDRYAHHPDLKTAVNDARAVVRVLKDQYYFDPENIILIENADATKERIMQAFRDMVARKVKKGDNIFIYYAGHGWFDDILEAGYWVTAEATASPASFLENNTIYRFIAALDKQGVRHVLLVSDACFSGSFIEDHRAVETAIDDRYFRQKIARPSRSVITSGGNEPVADGGREGHSVFAYYFLKTLRENTYPYLSVKQVGARVESLVTRNSRQTPVSRYIHGVGDEGGSFSSSTARRADAWLEKRPFLLPQPQATIREGAGSLRFLWRNPHLPVKEAHISSQPISVKAGTIAMVRKYLGEGI